MILRRSHGGRTAERVGVAVALLVVLAAAAVVAVMVLPRGAGPIVDAGRATPGSVAVAPGEWAMLPPAPIEARANAVAVWTGRELLLWGGHWTARMGTHPQQVRTGTRREHDGETVPLGDVSLANGAAYDPVAERWRVIPAAPISGAPGDQARWTGQEMIVLGVRDGVLAGAAYDPAADRWRVLPPFPVDGPLDASLAWTGTELLAWGSFDHDERRPPAGASYDPATDRWSPLPPSPVEPRQWRASVWTGDELIVWGGTDWNAAVAEPMGAAYSPATASWRRIPDGPLRGRSWATATWTGEHVLVWGGEAVGGGRYDPDEDRWQRMATAPVDPRSHGAAAWTGRELLVWGGTSRLGRSLEEAAAYDAAADEWSVLPPSGLGPRCGHVAVWADDRLLVWSGQSECGFSAPLGDGAEWLPQVPAGPGADDDRTDVAQGAPSATVIASTSRSPAAFEPPPLAVSPRSTCRSSRRRRSGRERPLRAGRHPSSSDTARPPGSRTPEWSRSRSCGTA